jgi:hypothetical protein
VIAYFKGEKGEEVKVEGDGQKPSSESEKSKKSSLASLGIV